MLDVNLSTSNKNTAVCDCCMDPIRRKLLAFQQSGTSIHIQVFGQVYENVTIDRVVEGIIIGTQEGLDPVLISICEIMRLGNFIIA
ncbi:hypothetical protein ACSVDA_15730 [Cytobacillus sp. Hm23]